MWKVCFVLFAFECTKPIINMCSTSVRQCPPDNTKITISYELYVKWIHAPTDPYINTYQPSI